MIFVNKMERERADFAVVLDQIHRVLSPQAVAVQLPIGSESSFEAWSIWSRRRPIVFRRRS